jgi:N-acetylglucosamine-6-sulfatase
MTRRRRWPAAALLSATLLLVGIQPEVGHGQATTKPNIVVIMVDDFDQASFASLLVGGLMPNLTRYFLQAGFTFTDSFSVAGLGGPARASFLTGQYPHNHNVQWGFPPSGIEALSDTSTVATWLQAAGYRTAHVGRYVTGYGWWTDGTRIPPGWNEWNTLLDPGSNNLQEYSININGTIVDVGALSRSLGSELHQTDITAVLAKGFVERTAPTAEPFFLVVTPGAFNLATNPPYNACPEATFPVYDPLFEGHILGAGQKPAGRHLDTIYGNVANFPLPRGPNFAEADTSDKPAFVRGIGGWRDEDYDCLQRRWWRKLEVLRGIDDLVGAVMGALETTGTLGNTVAIFTADNGWMDLQHRVSGKAMPYEEAIRVPLVVRTRGNTQPRLVRKMALTTDLAPTIAQFAQATPTHPVDGRSLVPVLLNPETTAWRKIGLIQYVGGIDPFAGRELPPSFLALRTDRTTRPRMFARYPLLLGLNGELYDLAADPYQLENRYTWSGIWQNERSWLQQWLDVLKECEGTGCQTLENYFYFN